MPRPRSNLPGWLARLGLVLAFATLACQPATPAATSTPAPAPTPATAAVSKPVSSPSAAVPSVSPSPSASPAPSGTVPTGQLTIDQAAEIESLDPYLSYEVAGFSVHHNLFDYLVERDSQGKLVPGLAESWRAIDDTTLELALRRGVKFHNGEDFNADAVKLSVERIQDPALKSNIASRFASIKEVRVVGPYTVQLLLARVDGALLDNLSSSLAIVPPGYTRQVGNDGFARNPVGTGPFKFVEWVRGDHLTLEANEAYWAGSSKGRARVKTAVFRPVTNLGTRVADLRSGLAQIAVGLTSDQAQELKGVSGVHLAQADTPAYQYVFFNARAAGTPFADQRVRVALNDAVDRQALVGQLLGGFGVALTQAVGPLTPGYDPNLPGFSHDPARARQLLADAGYPNGFDTNLYVTQTERTDFVEAVAAQLGQVGVRVSIQTLETGAFNDRWVKRSFDGPWFVRWSTFADPGALNTLASCNGFLSTFCSQTADTFLQQGEATLDPARRAEAYQKAMRALNDDPFAIYLNGVVSLYGVSDRVSDWQPSSAGYVYATNAALR